MKISPKRIKESVRIKDTWAIWHPEDRRSDIERKKDTYTTKELENWYGTESRIWKEIKSKKTKPEVLFLGEAPIRNKKKKNDDLIDGINLKIQCFHSNSPTDRLIKESFDKNPFFYGSFLTDFFHSAYKFNEEELHINDVENRFPEQFLRIKEKEEKHFIENLKKGVGSKAIICYGNIQKKEVEKLGSRAKHTETNYKNRRLKIFKVDHPSPKNPYRRELIEELNLIRKNLKTETSFPTPKDERRIRERDKFCIYCSKKFSVSEKGTREHLNNKKDWDSVGDYYKKGSNFVV